MPNAQDIPDVESEDEAATTNEKATVRTSEDEEADIILKKLRKVEKAKAPEHYKVEKAKAPEQYKQRWKKDPKTPGRYTKKPKILKLVKPVYKTKSKPSKYNNAPKAKKYEKAAPPKYEKSVPVIKKY